MQAIETQVTSTATAGVSLPVTLRVREHGDRGSATHVVLLHGYPDDQDMWEPVVEELPADWHVVTYDSRGTGGSSRPEGSAAYRLALLVEDLIAVLDATVPAGEKVHLVGHDWGSSLGWDAVAASTWDPRLEDRLASYTSCSGPPLDHLGSRSEGWAGRRRMLPQTLHSWYVWFFLLPGLPELTWRRLQWLVRPLMQRIDPTIGLIPWGSTARHDAVPAIGIYRANVVQRLRRPLPWRTSLPVLLVVALRDGFVVPSSLDGLEARCRDLTRVEVDEGHWLPRARPTELADLVTGFVQRHSA